MECLLGKRGSNRIVSLRPELSLSQVTPHLGNEMNQNDTC